MDALVNGVVRLEIMQVAINSMLDTSWTTSLLDRMVNTRELGPADMTYASRRTGQVCMFTCLRSGVVGLLVLGETERGGLLIEVFLGLVWKTLNDRVPRRLLLGGRVVESGKGMKMRRGRGKGEPLRRRGRKLG